MTYLLMAGLCTVAITFAGLGFWANLLLGLVGTICTLIAAMTYMMSRKRRTLWQNILADQAKPDTLETPLYRQLLRLYDVPQDPDHPKFKSRFTQMVLEAYRFNARHPNQDRDISAFHLLGGYRRAMAERFGEGFNPHHPNIIKAYADVTVARLADAQATRPGKRRKYLARSEPNGLEEFFDDQGKAIITNDFGKKLVTS